MQPDMSIWQGRIDGEEGPQALRWHQCVRPYAPAPEAAVVLLGFACDEGVRRNQGRPGAAEGPRAIRKALANFAWHQEIPVYDAGDLACGDGDLTAAQGRLSRNAFLLLKDGKKKVLVLGGGHETALGTFGALHPFYHNLGIINIDAHFDLRSGAMSTSGTPFREMADHLRTISAGLFNYFCLGIAEPANTAALFERARELGVMWLLDTELGPWRPDGPLKELENFVRTKEYLYLSVDLDVLPAAVMPAVSAPAARGVPLESVEALIAAVLRTGKTVAVDVVEFNPSLDADGRAARVAARLVWQIARQWTVSPDFRSAEREM